MPNTVHSALLERLTAPDFKTYLSAFDFALDHLRRGTLEGYDLNQEGIERLCAVLVLEQWAEFPDYQAQLANMTTQLSVHAGLLLEREVAYDLRGLALFVDGLLEGEHCTNGFLIVAHNGYLQCETAASSIEGYLVRKGEGELANFFREAAEWFGAIRDAQFCVRAFLVDVVLWTQDMMDGFFNILHVATVPDQSMMLHTLYKVLDQEPVKNMFQNYLGTLRRVQSKLRSGDPEVSPDELASIGALIEMVEAEARARGT